MNLRFAMECVEGAIDDETERTFYIREAREWLVSQAILARGQYAQEDAFRFSLLADALLFTPPEEISPDRLEGFLKLLARLNIQASLSFMECRKELVRLDFHVTPQG